MKLSMTILPVLAGFGLAAITSEKGLNALAAVEEMEKNTSADICCPATPCFVGCPTGGQWAVSVYRSSIGSAYNCFQDANSANLVLLLSAVIDPVDHSRLLSGALRHV